LELNFGAHFTGKLLRVRRTLHSFNIEYISVGRALLYLRDIKKTKCCTPILSYILVWINALCRSSLWRRYAILLARSKFSWNIQGIFIQYSDFIDILWRFFYCSGTFGILVIWIELSVNIYNVSWVVLLHF